MGSEISKQTEEDEIKIVVKEKKPKYEPPKIIPFPHRNEKRWSETVEFLSQDLTSFEDLKAIFSTIEPNRKYSQSV
jgi:hypothetical protein